MKPMAQPCCGRAADFEVAVEVDENQSESEILIPIPIRILFSNRYRVGGFLPVCWAGAVVFKHEP